MDERSPHGFVLYWRAVVTPLMTTAAERRPCTAYLMGCPAIAEKIYRHDPAVMLCALLRALIYIDPGDRTRFAVDHPSTVFAGFADQTIAELGTGLDHQFAELLKVLGIGTAEVLRAAGLAGQTSIRPPTTPIPRGLTRYLNRRFARVRQGGNVQVPMMVQPPAGRCTWRVVRT
jgi:hypothetical protein